MKSQRFVLIVLVVAIVGIALWWFMRPMTVTPGKVAVALMPAKVEASNSTLTSHWDAVIDGAVAGLVASLVITILTFSRNYVKDRILEHKIRKTIKSTCLGGGINGITATIRNECEIDIRIREVTLQTDQLHFKLNSVAEQSNISQTSAFGTTSPIAPPERDEPFPRVSPYSGFTYMLLAQFVTHYHSDLKNIRIAVVIEYASYSGHKIILTEHSEEPANKISKAILDNFLKQYRDGSLNIARMRFNLPPIPILPQK